MQCAFYAIKNDSTFVIEKEERPRTFLKKNFSPPKRWKRFSLLQQQQLDFLPAMISVLQNLWFGIGKSSFSKTKRIAKVWSVDWICTKMRFLEQISPFLSYELTRKCHKRFIISTSVKKVLSLWGIRGRDLLIVCRTKWPLADRSD